jgi:hypothetical protein
MGDPLSVPAAPCALDTSQPSSQLAPETRDSLASITAFLCQLIFAARDLANANILTSDYRGPNGLIPDGNQVCSDCVMQAHGRRLPHTASCRVGRVLDLLERLSDLRPAPVSPTIPVRKEDAPVAIGPRGEFGEAWMVRKWPNLGKVGVYDRTGDMALEGTLHDGGRDLELLTRVAACLNFCDGISTDSLHAQKPLMDPTRPVDEQIAIGRVLGLQAVTR